MKCVIICDHEGDTMDVKNILVNEYFFKQVEKVYINRCNRLGIETFEKYLNYRYQDNCYYYSAWALMGLDNNAKVVRGRININANRKPYLTYCTQRKWPNSNYYHGWVEFAFDGEEYVFDSLLPTIVSKNWYYKNKKPVVNYESTLEEVIKMCISDKDTEQIAPYTYRIGNLYMKYYDSQEKDTTYLAFPMSKAIIELETDKNKIKKFTAYAPPSG